MTGISKIGCAILAGLALSSHPLARGKEARAAHALLAIVHKTSAIDGLSTAELRKIRAGDRRAWPDGSAVVLAEQPEDSAAQVKMLRLLFKTTPAGYRRQLLEMQFQGKDLPLIKILNTDEAAVKFVWNVPGAIALVDAAVSAPALAHVKILRIDGQLPEDRGYPLE
jgi:hypothetical protein